MKDNDSYIYRKGTNPNTNVVISQKNKIYSVSYEGDSFSQVGVLSSFGISESRSADAVRGIGYGDQVAELVPGVTSPIELSTDRTMLYTANSHQVYGYAGGVDGLVRSLKHHQWPFDLKHEMVFSRIATNTAGNKNVAASSDGVNEALLTFFEACWINSYNYSFAADSAMVTEQVGMTVSDIIDGTSTYGELASDAESTGNNPWSDVGKGSIRFNSGTGTGTPQF